MGTDWNAEKFAAYNDIKDEGASIRIVLTTGGTYNPVTDSVSGGGTVGYSTYAINTKFRDAYDVNAHYIRSWQTQVKKGDRMLLVPSYGLPDITNAGSPDNYDLYYGGYKYNIVDSESIEPGGVSILFRVHARRNAKQ